TGRDVLVDGHEQRPERVEEALDVAARQPRRLSAELVHERGVSEQEIVWAVAVADPELLGLLRIPRHGGGGAVDLVLQAVLAAGGQLRHGELAARPRPRAQ